MTNALSVSVFISFKETDFCILLEIDCTEYGDLGKLLANQRQTHVTVEANQFEIFKTQSILELPN